MDGRLGAALPGLGPGPVLFSLTGIPPLAGFWGKLAVITRPNTGAADSSTQGWFIALAVIGVLNAAVSAGYYLRVVGVIFFRTPLATPPTREEPGLSLLATARFWSWRSASCPATGAVRLCVPVRRK